MTYTYFRETSYTTTTTTTVATTVVPTKTMVYVSTEVGLLIEVPYPSPVRVLIGEPDSSLAHEDPPSRDLSFPVRTLVSVLLTPIK